MGSSARLRLQREAPQIAAPFVRAAEDRFVEALAREFMHLNYTADATYEELAEARLALRRAAFRAGLVERMNGRLAELGWTGTGAA